MWRPRASSTSRRSWISLCKRRFCREAPLRGRPADPLLLHLWEALLRLALLGGRHHDAQGAGHGVPSDCPAGAASRGPQEAGLSIAKRFPKGIVHREERRRVLDPLGDERLVLRQGQVPPLGAGLRRLLRRRPPARAPRSPRSARARTTTSARCRASRRARRRSALAKGDAVLRGRRRRVRRRARGRRAAPTYVPFPSLKAAREAAKMPFVSSSGSRSPPRAAASSRMSQWAEVDDLVPVLEALAHHSDWNAVESQAPWVFESTTLPRHGGRRVRVLRGVRRHAPHGDHGAGLGRQGVRPDVRVQARPDLHDLGGRRLR